MLPELAKRGSDRVSACVRYADLERAADAAVFMIYSLNGERCTSSSRLLVAYVWTADVTRALRVTQALEAGMIWRCACDSET